MLARLVRLENVLRPILGCSSDAIHSSSLASFSARARALAAFERLSCAREEASGY